MPVCARMHRRSQPIKTRENGSIVGILLTCAKFHFVDLGDLPWLQEQKLACPVNMLGTVDVYQTTHHQRGQRIAKRREDDRQHGTDWPMPGALAPLDGAA